MSCAPVKVNQISRTWYSRVYLCRKRPARSHWKGPFNDYRSCRWSHCKLLRHFCTAFSHALLVIPLTSSQSGTTMSCANSDVSGTRSHALHLKYLKSGVDWMYTIARWRFTRFSSSVFTWVTRRRFSIQLARINQDAVHSFVTRSRTFTFSPKKLQMYLLLMMNLTNCNN